MQNCRTFRLVVFLFLLAGGCQAPQRRTAYEPAVVEASAAKILDGFDPLRDAPSPPGANVLFQVDIIKGRQTDTTFLRIGLHNDNLDGITQIRINPPAGERTPEDTLDIRDANQKSYMLKPEQTSLKLKVATKDSQGAPMERVLTFQSEPALISVALYDVTGELLGSRFLLVPVRSLRSAFHHPVLLRMDEMKAGTLDDKSIQAIYEGFMEANASFKSLAMIILSTPLLEPIVRDFVPFSVKLSLFFRGANLTLATEKIEPLSETIDDVPPEYAAGALRMHNQLDVNDRTLIKATLDAGRPASPLDVCAGVLRFEGYSADYPSRRFRIRLISARRGESAKMPTSGPAGSGSLGKKLPTTRPSPTEREPELRRG